MPPQSRIGDIGSGHSSFPPTPVIAGSPNVFVNGRPAARLGDALAPHGSPSPSTPHGRSIAGGSGTVFINGRPASRIGDPIDCGGSLVTGSPNVFTGG
jgi:uncharacterized Zn-binding protein involved in type VI secretion